MGKNNKKKKTKTVDENDPEALKNQGNEEQMKGNFTDAIFYYTKAIELDGSKAVYFSNRAQAFISMEEFGKAVEDADTAIQLDPTHTKSFYRKAFALFETPQVEGNDKRAMETIEAGLATDPTNEDLLALQVEVKEQYDADHKINVAVEEKARFDAMFNWMKHDGASFDKLKMRYYAPDYRGVHASRDIAKGETILYVPKKEIITLEMAMQSPIGSQMAKFNHRNRLLSPKHSFLSCFLMEEKRKPDSYFRNFIDILPKNFTNFPIFYTTEERQWLEGSAMQNVISDKIKDIQTDYNLITTEVPDFRQFSLREYSEMRMMVCSRIFGIQVEGVKTDGFVAYADMLNHQRPKETQWSYSDEREGFIIEATDDIKRGQQVYDSYGKKCNTRFLLNYGFINLNNDANEFPLVVHLNSNDPLFDQKRKMICEKNDCRAFRVQVNLEEVIMMKFISFLRFACFEGNMAHFFKLQNQWKKRDNQGDSDSDEEKSDTVFLADQIPPIDVKLEREIWESVKLLCEGALARFPTTPEQDREILKEEDRKLSFNERNCVLFRYGEKEILVFLIEFADYCLDLLSISFKEAKKKSQNLPEKFESARDYLQSQLCPLLSAHPQKK